MTALLTRASSINRALDEIGDKWSLLIIQEIFLQVNTFNELQAVTGASRGVLSNRLKWLEQVNCLRRQTDPARPNRPVYHLTRKSIDLYHSALMALQWERDWFPTPTLQALQFSHHRCGQVFTPRMQCNHCSEPVYVADVSYLPGPGATKDVRLTKVRRRSSTDITDSNQSRTVFRNFIHLIGDRWTANVIALAFHGLQRFDAFHQELPVATNILSGRLKMLVEEEVFEPKPYHAALKRYEYHLTPKGQAMFPFYLALLQWGDKWCDHSGQGRPMQLIHNHCQHDLIGVVSCSACNGALQAHEVSWQLPALG